MAVVKDISAVEFKETIAAGTVLVDFWAPWCSYCKVLGAVLEQTAVSTPPEIIIAKVNVDDNAELAAEYAITTLPTVIVFKDGAEVARESGSLSKSKVMELIS